MSGIRGYAEWPGDDVVVEWPNHAALSGDVLDAAGTPFVVRGEPGRPTLDAELWVVATPGGELGKRERAAARRHHRTLAERRGKQLASLEDAG